MSRCQRTLRSRRKILEQNSKDTFGSYPVRQSSSKTGRINPRHLRHWGSSSVFLSVHTKPSVTEITETVSTRTTSSVMRNTNKQNTATYSFVVIAVICVIFI